MIPSRRLPHPIVRPQYCAPIHLTTSPPPSPALQMSVACPQLQLWPAPPLLPHQHRPASSILMKRNHTDDIYTLAPPSPPSKMMQRVKHTITSSSSPSPYILQSTLSLATSPSMKKHIDIQSSTPSLIPSSLSTFSSSSVSLCEPPSSFWSSYSPSNRAQCLGSEVCSGNDAGSCLLCTRNIPDPVLFDPSWTDILRVSLFCMRHDDEKHGGVKDMYVSLKHEIYPFLLNHWNVLCKNKSDDPRIWHKQIQDTLSHRTFYFESGTKHFHHYGFWRLRLEVPSDPWHKGTYVASTYHHHHPHSSTTIHTNKRTTL
eukprot:TRINITY_DN4332_c0_g2_i1.p1 TRINITY_DN4332_c0_g2~~TRINITY_DN4332_c0_g2_i1.p1  ORF type:complete len:314 (-),score=43.51 TRINITY_DN4332_c0_g2_i1:42-983(-)